MSYRSWLRGRGSVLLTGLLGDQRMRYRQQPSRSAVSQAALRRNYQQAVANGEQLPALRDVGFQEYSFSDEDGILLFLFAVCGATNRVFVDIGAAGVEGSNSANLIVNDGWWGLHIEGREAALEYSQRFYRRAQSSRLFPPTAVPAFVSAENINELIEENGVCGEIDLLSIDIDSNDYWVWKAIDVVSPRVVVIEYQVALGPEPALTIPYDPAFDRSAYTINQPPAEIVYAGASLRALTRLGSSKGYSLVGCDRLNGNAFFVRNDVLGARLPVAAVEDCFTHQRSRTLIAEYSGRILDMPWVEVPPTQ